MTEGNNNFQWKDFIYQKKVYGHILLEFSEHTHGRVSKMFRRFQSKLQNLPTNFKLIFRIISA